MNFSNSNHRRKGVILSPSLLSANFADLTASVRQIEAGGADWLHIDVMDGHFVPNITVGPIIVEALRPITELLLDVHLMIDDPDAYIPQFINAGADLVTVHLEACVHLNRTVAHIKSLGVKAGVALNPATPLGMLEEILPDVDLVLLMSVNPGFGGQAFLPSLFRRARTLRNWIDREGFECTIEADGGIKLDNAAQVYEAGVDAIVSGSGVFETPNPAETIREMRRACEATKLIEV
ncbi:MAG TPA: ribulose-phosphate 3-epimerase [Candidatus Kapabacteria bacterium]|nr:ribulose-phosphate 3-epimerase [Candidatus Kapabacteria bacterium]